MGPKYKAIVASLAVLVVAGLAVMQITNKDLLQGKLDTDLGTQAEVKLPDLKPTLQVLPNDDKGNLKIGVTIENVGLGVVSNTTQYNYTVYVNDQLIFTNTDAYSEMGPGNKFSFTYPIEKLIYNYPETGTVKIVVDKDAVVTETNEENNTAEASYKL